MRSLALAVADVSWPSFVAATGQTSVGTSPERSRDSAGAPVAGVVIQIAGPGSRTADARLSDATRRFTFERVPLADYDVTALFAGFSTFQDAHHGRQPRQTRARHRAAGRRPCRDSGGLAGAGAARRGWRTEWRGQISHGGRNGRQRIAKMRSARHFRRRCRLSNVATVPTRGRRPAISTPKPTIASTTTRSAASRTIRSRRSRSTSTPPPTPTSAAS